MRISVAPEPAGPIVYTTGAVPVTGATVASTEFDVLHVPPGVASLTVNDVGSVHTDAGATIAAGAVLEDIVIPSQCWAQPVAALTATTL